MLHRDYYPLIALEEKQGYSVGDLVHLGIQNRAQICVNVYGMASGLSRNRIDVEPEESDELEPQIEEEIKAAYEYEKWLERTTRGMSDGIFELDVETLRFIEMPDGLPFELFSAMKFVDNYWWDVEFDPPVTIRLEHLCMLPEEVERLSIEKNALDVVAEPKPKTDAPDIEHISNDLNILNRAAFEFWSSADLDDKNTHPTNKQVADWLKEQGYSDISAKQGAVIIRPEWAANGRRPIK